MKIWLPMVSAVLFVLLSGGCAQESARQTPPNVPAAAGDQGDPIDADAPIYRVRYTGRSGQSPDQLRQSALQAAAERARSQGHTHFAVIEEGTETVAGPGSISSVGATVPIARSQRRGGRLRSPGSTMSIELGRQTAPAYFIRMRPFSGKPPQDAVGTYSVDEFQ